MCLQRKNSKIILHLVKRSFNSSHFIILLHTVHDMSVTVMRMNKFIVVFHMLLGRKKQSLKHNESSLEYKEEL